MVLGIDEKDMLDASKVKIIDSIAGAGKSSMLDAFMRQNGVDYLRLTSTNTLKKDAIERFGGNVKTICAGLFDNRGGFRSEEKEVEYKTVVLDEILQDGWQALKWVQHHIGSGVNMILTCDSHQMLAPEAEEMVKKVFEELKAHPSVIYSNINVTLRGITQETRDEVKRLYTDDNSYHGTDVMQMYKTVKLEDVTFDKNNVYLVHTNELEHYLYKTFNLSDCDLIAKGQQSGKEPVRGKYPLFDEMTARLKHVLNYYQASNIATPTRYQGSEVMPGSTGYYFVEGYSSISARELYTVVSRFKNIDDLVIVDCTGYEKTKQIEKFQGKDVKEMKSLILEKEFDGKMKVRNDDEMIAIIDKAKDKRYYYNIETVYAIKDDRMYVQYINSNAIKKTERTHLSEVETGNFFIDLAEKCKFIKSLAGSLSKKCPSIQYDFMPRVYEKIGTTFKGAMLKNERGIKKEDFEHQVDLFSAYGTVIKNCKMPTSKAFYEYYDKDKLNWYICNSSKLSGIHNLITEELAAELHMDECKFVFATDYQISNEIGDYVYSQSRKSKESKAKMKMHWGYYEKKYIEMKHSGYMHEDKAYIDAVPVLQRTNVNELFMCAIKSALATVMLRARESVGGGYVCTDALYYNGDVQPDLPSWAWYRICTGRKDNGEYSGIEFQNYEDLKTDKELKNEKEKAKIAALDSDEAAARKARRAEAERARRAAKKAAETPEEAEERRRKDRERQAKMRQS